MTFSTVCSVSTIMIVEDISVLKLILQDYLFITHNIQLQLIGCIDLRTIFKIRSVEYYNNLFNVHKLRFCLINFSLQLTIYLVIILFSSFMQDLCCATVNRFNRFIIIIN